MQGQWFESWFDSPWYPILYSHRDYAEAEAFISKLLEALAPESGARFLDLACGRGRHSIYIHRHGYDVTGLDLSPASIADANLSATEGLRFAVHDMRLPLAATYDFILNLFTSFGYFRSHAENVAVLRNASKSLAPEGIFVLDFFNVHKVLKDMVPFQTVVREGIEFKIEKRFEKGSIVKTISFVDNGSAHQFQEQVMGLDLGDFTALFEEAGLVVSQAWGDYNGAAFDADHSPRLILFGKHRDQGGELPS